MPAPQTEWTPEMARNFPEDGNRYELLDGELVVNPAPSGQHQATLLRLVRLVDDYERQHRLGWTMLSPADLELSPRTVVQPDLFVVPDEGTGEPRSRADSRLVERWQPDDERPEVITDILEWHPRPLIPPLLISLPHVFGPEK